MEDSTPRYFWGDDNFDNLKPGKVVPFSDNLTLVNFELELDCRKVPHFRSLAALCVLSHVLETGTHDKNTKSLHRVVAR